jgi:hypothetical protein
MRFWKLMKNNNEKNSVLKAKRHVHFMLLGLAAICCSANLLAQYEDNPLKGKRWMTITTGANSMDYISWQGLATYSKRGENVLTQVRLGYSQELIQPKNDSCSLRLNRLSEFCVLWGDGWGGKQWYVTGSIGFGLDVRMFCRHNVYEDKYLTAVTFGLPAQVEFGFLVSKKVGINLTGVANWNFRAPYVGGLIGIYYQLDKLK